MEQKMQLEVQIPSNLILIKQSDYETLLKEQLIGRVWSMKQLEEVTNRSGQWLRQNILEIPEFREELKQFVYFPKSQGERWKFGALKMSEWLEENQKLIFK